VRRARIKRQAGEPSIVTIKRYVPGCTKTSNLGGKRYGWRRCRTSLDFYLYTESEDKIELAADAWKKKGTDWKSQHSLHSKENIFPIQKATMQDFSVKVPNLPAEVLNQLYGDNYMTFDEDFHSG
jgi:hypothetical protein